MNSSRATCITSVHKKAIRASTTESLRKFYEKGKYALLKKEETLDNLVCLAHFWQDIDNQNEERFSNRVLRRLFVLNYAPNSMWTYVVSVYFMQNRNSEDNNSLDDEPFFLFLNRIIAFIWAYALTNPGVNSLRTPIYTEMVSIVEDKDVTFSNFLFDEERLRSIFSTYTFSNNRPLTKSMLTWWAFNNNDQQFLPLDTTLDIEHIYPRNRHKNEPLSDPNLLEMLGNKSILERRINIRASDYHFADKVKYYNGKIQKKEATKILELKSLADTHSDFTEDDIRSRNNAILDSFILYLKANDLIKPSSQPES